MCFVCGVANPIGLKLAFYEDEEGQVIAHFTPREEHQGYPGVLHGGIIATLLDEVAGRVASHLDLWTTTARLEIKYHQPAPIGQPLTIIGRITRLRSRALLVPGPRVAAAAASLGWQGSIVAAATAEDEAMFAALTRLAAGSPPAA
jgi:uncharacterized protein (TIGR00369 family)